MFCLEFVFSKSGKHLAKVCPMFICILAVHEYIVQVHQRKFVDIVTQHTIHEFLEHAYGITQAQCKYGIFIKFVVYYKR